MKILTSAQIKELDKLTIKKQEISSWELMERASNAVTAELLEEINPNDKVLIFCGKGNNGGDGLAIARLLADNDFQVEVYLWKAENYSNDNLQNQKLLLEKRISVTYFTPNQDLTISENCVIIDALFGNGLNAPLSEEWQHLFNQINASTPKQIFAIDLPSGFLPEQAMNSAMPCLHANQVYTFQLPKLGLLFPKSAEFIDDFKIVDINLDKATQDSFNSNYFYVIKEDAAKILKPISRFAHKGNFGHILIIGGSYGKIGAPVLATKAALKTGSGLVTTFVPKCGYNILQSTIPEAMCETDQENEFITEIPSVTSFQSIAIGMGIGQNRRTKDAVKACLAANPTSKFVIDADALNILAEEENPFENIPKGSILTPHPKELERLIGSWKDDFEKLERAKEIAIQYGINILIKGANTVSVLTSGECYFNSSGNWGMATGGSGDTLSGILASLLGQGYNSKETCILGVYLHGLAGDLTSHELNPHAVCASDISDYLGRAYQVLMKQKL